MRMTLIIMLCITIFLFTACSEKAETTASAPTVSAATESATATAPLPMVIPTPSPTPEPMAIPTPSPTSEPTAIPTPSPTPEPTAAPTPHPTPDLSAIKGTWYYTGDSHLSIVFHTNGTADFHGSPAECTGYEFDAHTMTGTIYLDDGGGPFPYDISIVDGNLNLLGEIYSRSPIVGTWYKTSDQDTYIVFHANGTADFHGSPAECTVYEFDAYTMTGTIYLDDGGGPFPYDISIVDGSLNLLGELYTR